MVRSPALLALTASALAALGTSPRAQADESGPRADYRFSSYREADIPSEQLSGSDGQRYEIDSHQFRLVEPLGDHFGLEAEVTYETLSGASPWFVQPGPGGRPVQVMSGASIREERTDLLLGLTRSGDGAATTVQAGYSQEDDYRATNGALQYEKTLADTVTTLSAGLGYSHDDLEPTQGKAPVGTTGATRSGTTVFAGYARVLDALTAVQTTLSYTFHDGYLSDPYKQAYITSGPGVVQDNRPDTRSQVAWLTRLRHWFRGPDAALHADYRWYHDDWEVDAHSVDLAWHQRFGAHLKLVPGLRWYSQSKAYFYQPYYSTQRADGLASSDYRLSPYAAVSGSLALTVDTGGWGFDLRYERYDSGTEFALGNVDLANPGLVDFDIASLGIKKVF